MDPSSREIEELVMLCFDLDPEDPASMVERACAVQPEFANDVRELIGLLDRAGLAREPQSGSEPQLFQDGAEDQECRLRTLGPYRILRQLGSGGMGQVYLAEQRNLNNRKVALKILRPELALSQRSRDRFQREIETLSSLDHPGICTVYDATEIDGTPVLAMRYLGGETLGERIRQGKSSRTGSASSAETVRESLEIMERVATSLHAAHELGLVHRDIKPANIMLVPGEGPVILDFGLVQTANLSGLTLTGDTLGTPAYMSPEQVRGENVDLRSDVYSLGATLYELLTGQAPYSASTRDLLYQSILNGNLSPASNRNRAVSRDIDIVLATALDHVPDRRYQSAMEFAEDLRRILNNETIFARRPTLALRARRWVERNPAVTASLLFLTAGLVITSALLTRSNRLQGDLLQALAVRDSVALAQNALALLNKDQTKALELAVAAVETVENVDTVSSLHQAYAHAHERLRVRLPGKVYRVRFEPGRSAFIVASATPSGRGSVLHELDDAGSIRRRFIAPNLAKPDTDQTSLAHRGVVSSIRFSPSGLRMLTVSQTAEVNIWNLESGKWDEHRSFFAPTTGSRSKKPHHGALVAADFLDEDHIVIAEGPGYGRLEGRSRLCVSAWRLGDAEPAWELSFKDTRIEALAVCRVRRRLAIVGEGGIHLFEFGLDPGLAPKLLRVVATKARILAIEFSPNCEAFVTADQTGRVNYYDAEGQFIKRLARVYGEVCSLAFDPSGQNLVIAGSQQAVLMIHLESEQIRSFLGHEGTAYSASFDSSGDRLLVTGAARCHMYDTSVPEVPHLVGHDARMMHASFDSSANRVLTSADDGTARVFDMEGRQVQKLDHGPVRVTWGRFKPDGNIMTATMVMKRLGAPAIHDWSGNHDERRQELQPGYGRVNAIHLRQDGLRLIATARLAHLRQPDGRVLPLLEDGPSSNAFFTPDGLHVITSFYTGRVWCAPTMQPDLRVVLVNQEGPGLSAATIAPDGRILATSHGDSQIRLWDVRKLEPQTTPIRMLEGHEGWVTSLVFSPDGQLLASGSQDTSAILWTRDGRRLARFQGHKGRINGVAFSRDGRRLVTASSDHTARVWITDTKELLLLARQRLRPEVVVPR